MQQSSVTCVYGTLDIASYWPDFFTPTVEGLKWSQIVQSYRVECDYWANVCPRIFPIDSGIRWRCVRRDLGEPETFSVTGACPPIGSPGGGGSGEEDEGGGCINCDCFYETVYTFEPDMEIGDGCGDVYSQVNYVCGGNVVTSFGQRHEGFTCHFEEGPGGILN